MFMFLLNMSSLNKVVLTIFQSVFFFLLHTFVIVKSNHIFKTLWFLLFPQRIHLPEYCWDFTVLQTFLEALLYSLHPWTWYFSSINSLRKFQRNFMSCINSWFLLIYSSFVSFHFLAGECWQNALDNCV